MIGGASDRADGIVVGVDVGGTFTDAVVLAGDGIHSAKVPSTPADQSIGALAAVEAALSAAGHPAKDVSGFTHGMTVGTNALLEGRGAHTALLATEGFTDVLELRRQNRAHLYRLADAHPPPLVAPADTIAVRERVGADGVLTPLNPQELARVVGLVAERAPESVAIGLLFSFAHPDHERALASALRERMPGVHVTASADLMPEIREYERVSTAAVDAYLTPAVGRYLSLLGAACVEAALPPPDIMLSNGGVLPIDDAAQHAALTVLSGPAGGVIGAAALARAAGESAVLSFDMGGTSTDVALIADGVPGRAPGSVIAGYPVHLPVLDIETVSAGGGSIAWADSGGALRVGPTSAGARPGPAAYGRGGHQPTVTDANVVLGRIDAESPLSGEVRLDASAAESAVARLAAELGLDAAACARGHRRGRRPGDGCRAAHRQRRTRRRPTRHHTRRVRRRGTAPCMPGGGRVGMRTDPRPAGGGHAGGVRSGGRAHPARSRADGSAGRRRSGCAAGGARPPAIPGGRRRSPAAASAKARTAATGDRVSPSPSPGSRRELDDLIAGFEEAYAERYGAADPGQPVEVVSLRAHAESERPAPPPPAGDEGVRAMGPVGRRIDGASLWIADGWRASPAEPAGTLMERTG